MTDLEQVALRRRHAERELVARGILKKGRFAPGMRLILRVFPRLKAPFYGDYAVYGAWLGLLFGVPMGAFVALPFALEGYPVLVVVGAGLGLGVLAGAMFGGIFAWHMAQTHKKMQLTPWEALDEMPDGEAPEGAATYDEVQAEVTKVAGLGVAVSRGLRK